MERISEEEIDAIRKKIDFHDLELESSIIQYLTENEQILADVDLSKDDFIYRPFANAFEILQRMDGYDDLEFKTLIGDTVFDIIDECPKKIKTITNFRKRVDLLKKSGLRTRVFNLMISGLKSLPKMENPEEYFAEMSEKLRLAATGKSNKKHTLLDTINEYEEFLKTPPVKTGMDRLDNILKIRPGQLIVIGGGTSSGKTALMLNMSRHSKTLYVSLEMTPTEMDIRRVAIDSQKSLSFIEKGTAESWRVMQRFLADFEKKTFEYFTDNELNQIRSYITNRVKYGGINLVCIDYLQLIKTYARTELEKITHITRELKQLAMRLRIPIICGSQLNRAGTQGGEPTIDSLRSSGTIEQDADSVILIHTVKENNKQLIIAKNRNGIAPMKGNFVFKKETQTWMHSDDLP